MKKTAEDFTGRQFGNWTVISRAPNVSKEHRGAMWNCLCVCGTQRAKGATVLRKGKSKSCGCTANVRHGQTDAYEGDSPEYAAWMNMRQRCRNPNNNAWHCYGGKGITVCERWNVFENFFADMGTRPSPTHSVERIKRNGDYCPENCKWATKKEQARNTDKNVFLNLNGFIMCIAEWAELVGIRGSVIGKRILRGWDVKRAILTPLNGSKRDWSKDIEEIKKARKAGVYLDELGIRYGVCGSRIHQLVKYNFPD